MIRLSPRRLLLAVPLLGAVIAFGCSKHFAGSLVGPPTILNCPAFALRDSVFTIQVTAAGGTQNLGGGSEIRFSPNAITGNATYRVTYASRQNGSRVAGVDITPVDNAPTQFNEPVFLRLSYSACPGLGDRALVIARKAKPGDTPTSVGGAKSASARYVEALIGHFTEYAIAM